VVSNNWQHLGFGLPRRYLAWRLREAARAGREVSVVLAKLRQLRTSRRAHRTTADRWRTWRERVGAEGVADRTIEKSAASSGVGARPIGVSADEASRQIPALTRPRALRQTLLGIYSA